MDLEKLAFALGKTHLASRQLLVFQRVHCFTIQALRIAVNDLNIPTIPCISFQLSQVGEGSPLKQGGAILLHPVKPLKQISWQCVCVMDVLTFT